MPYWDDPNTIRADEETILRFLQKAEGGSIPEGTIVESISIGTGSCSEKTPCYASVMYSQRGMRFEIIISLEAYYSHPSNPLRYSQHEDFRSWTKQLLKVKVLSPSDWNALADAYSEIARKNQFLVPRKTQTELQKLATWMSEASAFTHPPMAIGAISSISRALSEIMVQLKELENNGINARLKRPKT